MTPLERAETLEAWERYLARKNHLMLTEDDLRRTRMALRGAALDLRQIHKHDMEQLEKEEDSGSGAGSSPDRSS